MKLIVKPDETGHWHLYARDKTFACAIGKNGAIVDKREGDGKTPLGQWRLLYGFYRADHIQPPRTALPLTALSPNDGWCDDPLDSNYNRHVSLPFAASHEKLWRDDHLYDLVLVIDHNYDPPVPGMGSAVFLHVARPGYEGTEGCIALSTDDWFQLLPFLASGSEILISK